MATNNLINAKSPYLLQHAHNPVNWHIWGDEAFKKAKDEDKPIFLSIGYSTCHWCHVMAEESFSDPLVAEILNKDFISIKVDREERPDIDNIYMKAVMAITGSGGWPLSVFINHDLTPFYGGTYFPKEDKYGITGFKTILLSISRLWREKKEDLTKEGRGLLKALTEDISSQNKSESTLNIETINAAYHLLHEAYDYNYGGFGSAPKFPMGHTISFVLRCWHKTKDENALRIVKNTLTQMRHGGVYDQIGGGFHRYSTDQAWRVPHFEKMLYDQAILSRAYLEAWQATGEPLYADTARETLDYVLRDMTSEEGGFYSGEDADSAYDKKDPHKKEEGLFYIWGMDEIIKILGKKEAEIFSHRFGILPDGNVTADPHNNFAEKNIPYIAEEIKDIAESLKVSPLHIEDSIKRSKEKLFSVRSERMRPHRDEKILLDWNGLMISSLAFASRVLEEPRYLLAAEKAYRFILKNLQDKNGRLLHSYYKGGASVKGMIDDYAFFIHGLLDLYEASFNPEYIREAKRVTGEMIKLFWDRKEYGFFFTGDDTEEILFRQKEVYDGAIPSGNSIAARNLIRLERFTMDKNIKVKTDELFKYFSKAITENLQGYPQLLSALDLLISDSSDIIISAEDIGEGVKEIVKIIYKNFMPNKVVIFRPASGKDAEDITLLSPFSKNCLPIEKKPTLYLCKGFACNLPVNEMSEIRNLFKD